jgi:hypothetical protein
MLDQAGYDAIANFNGADIPAFLLSFLSASPQGLINYVLTGSFAIDTTAIFPSNHLYENLTSFDPTVLQAAFGITNNLPFTYIVQPLLAVELVNAFLPALGVEDFQTHVLINPMPASRDASVCDGVLDPVKSKTADCLAHNPIRRDGDRRYNTMFGTIFDPSPVAQAALDYMHVLGIKNIVAVSTALNPSTTLTEYQLNYLVEAAPTFNIDVSLSVRLDDYTSYCDPKKPATYPSTCPPFDLVNVTLGAQTQNWPANQSAFSLATQIAALNPDALVIFGEPSSAGTWAMSELFNQFHVVGWTPKAISIAGFTPQGQSNMPLEELHVVSSCARFSSLRPLALACTSCSDFLPFLNDKNDVDGMWLGKAWDRNLKGPIYKNLMTDTNYELFPADSTQYGPAKFANAYDAAYGPNRAGGGGVAHPMWTADWNDNTWPAIGWGTLVIVQKLIEKSQTRDVPSILAASTKVSSPGVFHSVQFDQYGRTERQNQILQQRFKNETRLLAPYNIAVPAIFPLPTWDERSFHPKFYDTTNEKVMLAINSVCIAVCVALLAFIMTQYKTPVIRAATPSFCLVIIVGGIFMLISNYFNTLVVNDAHCAASAWFLTLGFTMTFAALFIKTFRLWRIFGRKSLTVLKMKDSELLMAVAGFLLIDVIINAAWQGATGLKSEVVVTDVYRPAFNYTQCDYSDGGMSAVWAHIAVKAAILLVGTVLTWVVRNVPSQFNESASMAAAIYNVVFLVCFIIPIIATNVGGRSTTFMIRDFAVMFVVMATLGLLFIPKYMTSSSSTRVAVISGTGGANQTKMDNTENTPTKPGDDHGVMSHSGGIHPSGQRSLISPKTSTPVVERSVLQVNATRGQSPSPQPVGGAASYGGNEPNTPGMVEEEPNVTVTLHPMGTAVSEKYTPGQTGEAGDTVLESVGTE